MMLSFGFGCVNVVHADFLGIGRFWEDVKRQATRFARDVDRDTRRAARAVAEVAGVITAAMAIGEANHQVQRMIHG